MVNKAQSDTFPIDPTATIVRLVPVRIIPVEDLERGEDIGESPRARHASCGRREAK